MGKAMFTIVGAMAELERNLIRERIMAGLEHARARGTKSGRRIGRPAAVLDRVRLTELREAGLSFRDIANALSVSVATVWRVLSQGVSKPSRSERTADVEVKRFSAA